MRKVTGRDLEQRFGKLERGCDCRGISLRDDADKTACGVRKPGSACEVTSRQVVYDAERVILA